MSQKTNELTEEELKEQENRYRVEVREARRSYRRIVKALRKKKKVKW